MIRGVLVILASLGGSMAIAAPTTLPPLPKAVSSFGAAVADGYLYVYGGHVGKTHKYDTSTVIGTFHRLKLDGGTAWKSLPGGPILQGVNLAAHGGKIYRVGGMQPRNAPDQPTDTHSVADVARFDPAVGKWEALPPLPAPRSSHDLVVADGKLVVVGGWNQRGRGETPVWFDTALSLDLNAKTPQWKEIPQPFGRRALTATTVGSKVYVIGGIGEKGTVSHVEVLDIATGKWSTGPALPGGAFGFAPAAATVDGQVVVATSDGAISRLDLAKERWEKVGSANVKRMVARLVPKDRDSVILIGGSNAEGNVAEVEVIKLAAEVTK